MQRRVLTILLAAVLVACTSAPTATPTRAPLPIPTARATLTPPTSTPLPATATPIPPTSTATPTQTATPAPCNLPLRQCADRNQIEIGTYLNSQWFRDAKWRELVANEFNLAVVSSGFYWSDIEKTRGQFNFAFADEQIAFARSKNMRIAGHALLLPASPYIPEWLANGNFSREELAQLLRGFVVQVMSRYKGQIHEYIVLEDPFPGDRNDIFYPKFGYDYIDLLFQIARETDPSAVLIFNSGDNETSKGEMTPVTREIVQRLKTKGLIDGVGLEMHLDGMMHPERESKDTKADVIATMKSYGLPVYITEIDVGLKNVPGTPEERYAKQAQVYGDMFSACVETGMCKSFAVWGIGDKYSWLERASPNADATLYDDNLNPKPAYFAVREILR